MPWRWVQTPPLCSGLRRSPWGLETSACRLLIWTRGGRSHPEAQEAVLAVTPALPLGATQPQFPPVRLLVWARPARWPGRSHAVTAQASTPGPRPPPGLARAPDTWPCSEHPPRRLRYRLLLAPSPGSQHDPDRSEHLPSTPRGQPWGPGSATGRQEVPPTHAAAPQSPRVGLLRAHWGPPASEEKPATSLALRTPHPQGLGAGDSATGRIQSD